MKNEYSKNKLSYFLMPRIHGNVFAWNKPASPSNPERSKQATKNIQRWEDDGGPVSETESPLLQVPGPSIAGRMDVGPKTA